MKAPRLGFALAGTVIAVIGLAGLVALLAFGERGPDADPDDPKLVALGQRTYAAQCAACHGAELEGAPDWQEPLPDGELLAPAHDMTGHTWHHPDELLFAITKFGGQSQAPPGFKATMPGFEEILTDREIWAVLAYIMSHWTEDILDQRRRYLTPQR
jgi:mono/diheme cytochrome c family protein